MWHEVAACSIACELRSKIFVETGRHHLSLFKIAVAMFNTADPSGRAV